MSTTNTPSAAPQTPPTEVRVDTPPAAPSPQPAPSAPPQPAETQPLPEISKQALLAAKGDKVEDFDRLLRQHSHQQFIDLVRTMREQETQRTLEITRGLRRVLRARYEEIQRLDRQVCAQLQGLREHVEPVVAASAFKQDMQEAASVVAQPVGGMVASIMEGAKDWGKRVSAGLDRIPGGGKMKEGIKWFVEVVGDLIDDTKYFFGTSVPERAQKIGKFLGSWGAKMYYGMLASPQMLAGVLPFGASLAPHFSERAKDQLARIAAVETVESAIAAEQRVKPIEVTFDRDELNAKWENVPADKKSKEFWRAQTVAVLAAARTRGDAQVTITVDALLNPELRQKQTEQEAARVRTEKLRQAWGLPGAELRIEGDRPKAKKEATGTWTILLPKADAIGKDAEPMTPEARALRDVLPTMLSVQEIEIGGSQWELRRAETGVLAVLPTNIDRTLPQTIDALADGFRQWTRARVLRPDSGTMKEGQALVTYGVENNVGVLRFNTSTDLGLLSQFLAQADTRNADVNTTWAWMDVNGTTKWNPLPPKAS